MNVAVAQICCVPGDIDANCEKIVAMTREAAQKRCGIVLFPEMADIGYDPATVAVNARAWNREPFTKIARTARECAINIAVGLSEREGSAVHNSLAVISPEGTLHAHYRKIHLFPLEPNDETRYFTPGNSAVTVTLGECVWGLTICYDLRFPGLYRQMAAGGAHVLLNCAAWPAVRAGHWDTLLRARAIENCAYVIGVNRAGKDNNLVFAGHSAIIGPDGEIIAQAGAATEELLTGTVEKEKTVEYRGKMRVFKDIAGDGSGGGEGEEI